MTYGHVYWLVDTFCIFAVHRCLAFLKVQVGCDTHTYSQRLLPPQKPHNSVLLTSVKDIYHILGSGFMYRVPAGVAQVLWKNPNPNPNPNTNTIPSHCTTPV